MRPTIVKAALVSAQVLKLQTAAIEKQRADARELKEEEIRLRVSYFSHVFHLSS